MNDYFKQEEYLILKGIFIRFDDKNSIQSIFNNIIINIIIE